MDHFKEEVRKIFNPSKSQEKDYLKKDLSKILAELASIK